MTFRVTAPKTVQNMFCDRDHTMDHNNYSHTFGLTNTAEAAAIYIFTFVVPGCQETPVDLRFN